MALSKRERMSKRLAIQKLKESIALSALLSPMLYLLTKNGINMDSETSLLMLGSLGVSMKLFMSLQSMNNSTKEYDLDKYRLT